MVMRIYVTMSTTTYQITESDIRAFLQAPRNPWKSVVSALTTVVILAAAVWGGQTLLVPKATTSALTAVAATAAPTTQPVETNAPTAAPATPLPVTIPTNTLFADALGISAPIQWRVQMDQATMNDGLSKGLIHLEGTALPGQQGVTAIAGHSSNIIWAKGSYNSVFTPLTKAQPGQIIEVNYQDVMYRYEVVDSFEVQPTDVSVLASNTFTGLHLITCTPVGTSLRRLIVEAKQIFPDPSSNTPFQSNLTSALLPADQ